MSLERQSTFGWLVSVDIFLTSTGGGVFLASFMLNTLGKYEPMSIIGAISGPVLVLISAAFHVVDLGNRGKICRLFSNPSSWMTRGIWGMVFFVIFGLGYSLPSLGLFRWLPWSKTIMFGNIVGVIAAMASVLMLAYPGLLLSVIKRIPLWNTSALPLLFLLSGLCTGIACLLIAIPFFQTGIGQEAIVTFRTLMVAEIILILLQLVTLLAYLEIARHRGVSALESVRSLKTLLFIAGVFTAGLIIPLCLLFGALVASDISPHPTLAWVAGIFLLVGGIFLRYSIIRAGVYLPLSIRE